MEQLFFIRLNNRDCLLLQYGSGRTLKKVQIEKIKEHKDIIQMTELI